MPKTLGLLRFFRPKDMRDWAEPKPEPKVSSGRRKMLEFVKAVTGKPMSQKDVEEATGIANLTIARRQAASFGFIKEAGSRNHPSGGKPATLWRATREGEAFVKKGK